MRPRGAALVVPPPLASKHSSGNSPASPRIPAQGTQGWTRIPAHRNSWKQDNEGIRRRQICFTSGNLSPQVTPAALTRTALNFPPWLFTHRFPEAPSLTFSPRNPPHPHRHFGSRGHCPLVHVFPLVPSPRRRCSAGLALGERCCLSVCLSVRGLGRLGFVLAPGSDMPGKGKERKWVGAPI